MPRNETDLRPWPSRTPPVPDALRPHLKPEGIEAGGGMAIDSSMLRWMMAQSCVIGTISKGCSTCTPTSEIPTNMYLRTARRGEVGEAGARAEAGAEAGARTRARWRRARRSRCDEDPRGDGEGRHRSGEHHG